MRVLLRLTYDGTDFSGWQRQADKRTAQAAGEDALARLLNVPAVVLSASSRTDAGVHALSQYAHFDTDTLPMPVSNLAPALNTLLPPDIKILSAECVPANFHARVSAVNKTYVYKVYLSPIRDPLTRRTHHIITPPFDTEKARAALNFIVGKHDFTSFCYVDRIPKKTNIRTVTRADITENGSEILFTLAGKGFLHNMVRIIVGTVIKITKSNDPPEKMKEILSAKDRQAAASTAPACGLYLADVEFKGRG